MNEKGNFFITIKVKGNRVTTENLFYARKMLNTNIDQFIGIILKIVSPTDPKRILETVRFSIPLPSIELIEKTMEPTSKASMQEARTEAKSKLVAAFVEIYKKIGLVLAKTPLEQLNIITIPFDFDEIQSLVVEKLMELEQVASNTPVI